MLSTNNLTHLNPHSNILSPIKSMKLVTLFSDMSDEVIVEKTKNSPIETNSSAVRKLIEQNIECTDSMTNKAYTFINSPFV